MAMNEQTARTLIDVLTRAYPTYPADAGTIELYVQALRNDRYPPQVATAAVHTWVMNTPVMPKVNELLDAIETEATSRGAEERALGTGGNEPLSKEAALMFVRLSRQVAREMPLPEHRHHFGIEACEVCQGRADYEARYAARMQELMVEHPGMFDGPASTFVCVRCEDTGWEREELLDGTTVVRPCPCRPELYDRWREGHFEPNHTCAACAAAKKGNRRAS